MDSLRQILPSLTRAARDAGLGLLTIPAPAGALEAFLAAQIPGEALVWDPGTEECSESAWTIAGRGVAAHVEGQGADRAAVVRARAEALLDRIVERRDPEAWDAPAPRFFGGFSFVAGDAHADPAWSGFGEASFVLPRWTYGERGGRGFLRLAVDVEQLRDERALADEIRLVFAAIAARPPALPALEGALLVEQMPRGEWDALVEAALRAIRAGEMEKVVLARRSRVEAGQAFSLASAVMKLRAQADSVTRFAFQRGDSFFVGATPERLVSLCGERVECDALGGSLPRREGADPATLLASVKDRREHAAVVSGIRSVLSPLCREIAAPAAPAIRSLSAVHHLHTPVVAQLAKPGHVLDLVAALHPTPAVCGLPKEAAARFLAAQEPMSRGWYAAPIGWFDLGGDGCFAVALRSALIRGSEAWLYAGAGIVEGSDPEAEYRETAAKSRAMLGALGVSR